MAKLPQHDRSHKRLAHADGDARFFRCDRCPVASAPPPTAVAECYACGAYHNRRSATGKHKSRCHDCHAAYMARWRSRRSTSAEHRST